MVPRQVPFQVVPIILVCFENQTCVKEEGNRWSPLIKALIGSSQVGLSHGDHPLDPNLT